MRKIYFALMIVLCLLLTSCAEMLNGVWKWNFEDYSAFEGTTWEYTNADNLTDTLTFNSDGTYKEIIGSTTLKGEYSCTKNTATLKTLTYAQKNYGTEWKGTSNIQTYNYLLDGKLYNIVLENSSNSNSIEGTWNFSSSKIYTNSSSKIIGIGVKKWTYKFNNDKTFTREYSLTLDYDNVSDDVETTSTDSGTYSVVGTAITITYTDGDTESFTLCSSYLILNNSYYSSANLSSPSDLKLTATTYDTASLSWSSVTGATSYKIYYGKLTSSMTSSATSTTTSCTISNLDDDTTYYFSVMALNAVCNSEKSDSVSGKTTILSGTCGENATWTFDKGVLTISGSGKMTN